MINWFKNLPLDFRSPDRENEEISGPDFETAKPVVVEFSGTKIALSVPAHLSSNPEANSIYIAKSSAEEGGFVPIPNAATHNWGYKALISRRWSYRYAWFGGVASEMFFNVGVYSREAGKELKHTNFLHPKGFENALCNILDNEFGTKKNDRGPLYRGPVDWFTRNDLPVSAVEFWVKGSQDECNLAFPLTEACIGFISCGFMSHDKRMQEKGDPLVRQIFDSVKITLAPEFKAKFEKMQIDNPDVSISETFAPLKWPVDPKDIA